MKYIYHGSNAKLLDNGLVSGTFFTEDLKIALKYGEIIYCIDLDMYNSVFSKNWEEYYISHGFIPLEYFTILRRLSENATGI